MSQSTLSPLLTRLITLYQAQLTQSSEAQAFALSLGITEEVSTEIKLGYSNGQLIKHIGNHPKVIDALKSVGILNEADTEQFPNHLILPIFKDEVLVNLEFLELSSDQPGCALDSSRPFKFQKWLSNKKHGSQNIVTPDTQTEVHSKPKKRTAKKSKPGAISAPSPSDSNFDYPTDKYHIKYAEVRGGRMLVTLKVIGRNPNKFVLNTVNLYVKSQRSLFIAEVSVLLGQPKSKTETEVFQIIQHLENQEHMKEVPCFGHLITDVASNGSDDRIKKDALTFLKNPKLLDNIMLDLEELGYVGDGLNKLLGYLAMTSRKTERPISLMLVSTSASGKSALQQQLYELCPPEDRLHFSKITPQSLYYLGPDSLRHKFLSIEEDQGSLDAQYSLKVLLSSKTLSLASTAQDSLTGLKRVVQTVTQGPLSIIISSTSPSIDYELSTRVLSVSMDESTSQTEKILDYQRLSRTYSGQVQVDRNQGVIQKHHAIQRLLAPVVIVNNLATELSFPTDQLRFRRSHTHYLNLIEAIAFLRQFQKKVKRCEELGNYIEVDKVDVEWADRLFEPILKDWKTELKPMTQTLLEHIRQCCQEAGMSVFTRRMIRDRFTWENTALHRQLKLLCDLDYVRVKGLPNGYAHSYELLDPTGIATIS